jgi:hypothetical protein
VPGRKRPPSQLFLPPHIQSFAGDLELHSSLAFPMHILVALRLLRSACRPSYRVKMFLYNSSSLQLREKS